MSCSQRCNQGRTCDCAAINFAAESEGVMPMATGCSFKGPVKPVEPVPDTTDRFIHLGRWALLTLAVMAAAAATVGFFKH